VGTVDLMKIAFTVEEITRKRETVRQDFIKKSPLISGGEIKRISGWDLELLFQLYDAYFLSHFFSRYFKGKVFFSLSTRMTKSAGKTQSPRNLAELSPEQEEYQIKMGADFFFNYGLLERDKEVNGIKTRDALDALQLVFEHELCHLVELHCCGTSSCHQKRFKDLAFALFRHQGGYHHLPTGREIAADRFGLTTGAEVLFQHDGVLLRGFIYNINKRATVMVPDEEGAYKDQKGVRYEKWYVPLAELEKKDS